MRQSLEGAGEGITAQYGVESDMPKAKEQTSVPIYSEVIKRGKRWEKVKQFENKVSAIQSRIHVIKIRILLQYFKTLKCLGLESSVEIEFSAGLFYRTVAHRTLNVNRHDSGSKPKKLTLP